MKALSQNAPSASALPALESVLPPEVELLLTCAHLDLDDGQVRHLRSCLRRYLDWERVFELMVFHRLSGFTYRSLSLWGDGLVSQDILEALRNRHLSDGTQALRRMADLIEVLDLLEEGGVLAVPYKGPVLAARVYGNLAYRYCSDLDILVERDKVMQARSLLENAGFQSLHPGSLASREFLLRNRYSDIFVRPPVVVELHWAFTNGDVEFPLGLAEMKPRLERFEIGGSLLPVFERNDLLLILCVHGTNHCWNRLEWLVGVAELLRQDLDWTVVMRRARKLKAEKTLLLGLFLAKDLLGSELPPEIFARAQEDPDVRENAIVVRNGLKVPDPFTSLSSLDPLPRDLFRLRLQPGWRERLRYVLHRLVTPGREDTRLMVPLGTRSVPLPAFYRPLRVMVKLMSSIVRPRNPGKGR